MKKLVILESPYAGTSKIKLIRLFQRWLNVRYARACLRDSVMLGEYPIASHLSYTQPGVLNDDNPIERAMGIEAGLAWRGVAEATVVYTDRGISDGMEYGIKLAKDSGIPVIYRTLYEISCKKNGV